MKHESYGTRMGRRLRLAKLVVSKMGHSELVEVATMDQYNRYVDDEEQFEHDWKEHVDDGSEAVE